MPDADRASSGGTHGQPKILFKGQQPREGTATPPPARSAARVLFPGDAAGRRVAEPSPERPSGPAVPFGAPRPPPPKDQPPKVIAGGVVRRRVPCTDEELRRIDATATPAVISEAQHLIAIINLDDLYFDDALRFGADLQVEHAAIAEAELVLANAEPFRQGQSTLARVLQLLGMLDPQRLFVARQSGVVDKFKALLGPARPPGEVFAEEYPCLVALAQELRTLEPQLVELARQARELGARYGVLQDRIASHLLAASFLVRYIRDYPDHGENAAHYGSQADVLETRLASLLATRTTVELGRLNNEVLQQNVETLIAAGRGMLEEDLPAFFTSYTAALNTASQPGADVSRNEQAARDVHARLMRKVQGEQ